MVPVLVHGRIRLDGPHARATMLSSAVRVDSSSKLQYTLRIVPVEPGLQRTNLFPGFVLVEPERFFVDAAGAVVSWDALLQPVAVQVQRAGWGNGDLPTGLGGAQQTTPFLGRRVRVGVCVMMMLLLIVLVSCSGRVRIHVVRHILLLRHRAHLAHAATLLADHALETAGVAVQARLARDRVVAVVAVNATVAARGIHDGMTICRIGEVLDRIDRIPTKSHRRVAG